MTLVKWNKPFTTENRLSNRTVFNSPFTELFENLIGENLLTKDFASYVPAVNISEEEKYYNVELSAPGFLKEDFKIELRNGILSVSGEHKAQTEIKEKTFTKKEFNYGSFQRNFSLPDGINEESIEAKYENGILKIVIAKQEEQKKAIKEIKIS